MRAAGELQGHAPVHDGESKISRRGFMALGGAIVVAAMGGEYIFSNKSEAPVVDKDASADDEIISNKKVAVDGDVSVAQAETNINILVVPVMPDLYQERSWADPEQLLGLTPEELKAIAAMPITVETTSDKGFAEVFGQKLELIANAGRTPEDALRARKLGYLPDENGNRIGTYREYVKKYYIDYMIDGLFTDKYTDPKFAGADDLIKKFLAGYGNEYEYALTKEEWRDKATLFVAADFAGAGPRSKYERDLIINFETRRLAIDNNSNDVLCDGEVIVNASKGINGHYKLAAQYASVTGQ